MRLAAAICLCLSLIGCSEQSCEDWQNEYLVAEGAWMDAFSEDPSTAREETAELNAIRAERPEGCEFKTNI